MDLLTLARLQFAATTIYHFLFVPLTLGLSFLVAWMQYKYYKTHDKAWDTLTRYFGTLFLINFAVGVVTGIVQEFQFGMNWSNYSRFVGDIFGAPLAIEALAAFFLESTFLGLWIFGRDKLSPKIHLATIWIVAFASSLSALWILIANSFMQSPTAFKIVETAFGPRAEMTDFFALITNPHVLRQFPHVLASGLATGSIFVLSISALNLLMNHKNDIFKKLIKPMSIIGAIALILSVGAGDAQGKYITKHQPMKLATAEALWDTTAQAPFSIFAVIDEKRGMNGISLEIPYALSILATNDPNATVQGINDLQTQYEAEYGPGDYTPPVALMFYSFRAMVYAGTLMLLVMIFSIIFSKKLQQHKWYYVLLVLMLPLPYLCNTAGWIFAEVGRTPWLVQGVLKLQDGISTATSASATTVLVSLIGFVVLYGVLAVIDVSLMANFIKKGIKNVEQIIQEEDEVITTW